MLSFIKKYKYVIIIAAAVVAALVIAFFVGGNVQQAKEMTSSSVPLTTVKQTAAPAASSAIPDTTSASTAQTSTTKPTTKPTTAAATSAPPALATTTTPPTTEIREEPTARPTEIKHQDAYQTAPVPSGKPAPVEPQEQTTQDNTLYCTLSISCATILDNMDLLDEEKTELVPEDGWLLKPTRLAFQEGESVFDILVRECKSRKIHMSYRFTPIYNSDYIEGIGNLYEFDCGGQSGWNYSVNGWFPNYGSSRYVVQDGDMIEWKYTCNLGLDTGAGNQYE